VAPPFLFGERSSFFLVRMVHRVPESICSSCVLIVDEFADRSYAMPFTYPQASPEASLATYCRIKT
jgi:hypothetical protein